MRQFLTALLLIGALNGVTSAAQEDIERTRAEIEALERDIARITAAQKARQGERSVIQRQLLQSEKALNAIRQKERQTAAAVEETRSEIAALKRRQTDLNQAAIAQHEAVGAELRAIWKSQGNSQLKLLLEESDPQRLARMLAYYRYILGARYELLNSYQATLDELSSIATNLTSREKSLAQQRSTLGEQTRSLDTAQRERQRVLATIDSELISDAALLAARQQDRKQLEALLEEIEATVAVSFPLDDVQPFSAAKGQMNWPVDGPITRRFGTSRNQGKMRWQGIRMRADAGAPVAAIHHGRVVFADWLRGSGLLLVIDHGEGYMSLYAHNESLLYDVGDWVNGGAAIATVGDSGGQEETGLYFEIRKDGKPTNPQAWCRS